MICIPNKLRLQDKYYGDTWINNSPAKKEDALEWAKCIMEHGGPIEIEITDFYTPDWLELTAKHKWNIKAGLPDYYPQMYLSVNLAEPNQPWHYLFGLN